MAWILTIDVVDTSPESVSDQLWTFGTTGIAFVEEGTGENGTVQLLAGFDDRDCAERAAAMLGGTVTAIDPAAWNVPDPTSVEVGGRSISIEAGHSFGHGRHPTTQLCLAALERHVRPEDAVLDVGCGSGVLAIAARVLGASPVVAIDIDPAAIEATGRNATENGLDVDVRSTAIAELTDRFDLVVANVLIAELEPMAADVAGLGLGCVVVSGALTTQSDRIAAALGPDFRPIEETSDGEWCCVVFERQTACS